MLCLRASDAAALLPRDYFFFGFFDAATVAMRRLP